MIYGKLPIVFLGTLASEKSGSTNSVIASYILNHLKTLQDIGIRELAERCNVSVSSISRFCKEVGLRDFAELREMLSFPNLYFEEKAADFPLEDAAQKLCRDICGSILLAQKSLSLPLISQLCDDLSQYEQVAAFGLLKAGAVAISLQADLLMLGKQIYTNISYAEQLEYLFHADHRNLIIIFSYTGSYFDYQDFRSKSQNLYPPKIWLISGSSAPAPRFVDRVIHFDSRQDQCSHPYQMQYIESLIAQEYARKIHTP